MEEYWIGDQVIIKPTRQVGKFEGVYPSGKFKIQVNGSHLEIDPNDLELYTPEEEPDDFLLEMDTTPLQKSLTFSPVIDLHIQVLAPAQANEHPHVIVAHQLKKCKEFIQTAIKKQVPQIKIIHGKGSGTLKAEVLHLLRHIPEVFIIQEVHQGGAQEVILRDRK